MEQMESAKRIYSGSSRTGRRYSRTGTGWVLSDRTGRILSVLWTRKILSVLRTMRIISGQREGDSCNYDIFAGGSSRLF